jgi:hypothetical protein
MQISIRNCPDKAFKEYVLDAAEFYAKELLPSNRVRNNCALKIRFSNKIDEFGYASVLKCNKSNQPRSFLIEIHPGIGARRILETLAHEMVHVKQYVNGELNDRLSAWCGVKVDSTKVDYWSHPWEIDAFGRETGLLYKYATSRCLWEIFDDFRNPELPIVSTPIRWLSV